MRTLRARAWGRLLRHASVSHPAQRWTGCVRANRGPVMCVFCGTLDKDGVATAEGTRTAATQALTFDGSLRDHSQPPPHTHEQRWLTQ